MARRALIIRAPIHDMSGYANFSRRLVVALSKDPKYDILLEPLMWANSNIIELPSDQMNLFDALSRRRVIRSRAVLLHTSIAHEFHADCGYNIGYTMLETDRISQAWRMACNTMNEIWTPSLFNQKTFKDSGVVVPIRTLPLSVDTETYNDSVEPLEIPGVTTKFNLLALGQLGGGDQDRKGIIQLIHVFLNTFRGNPDVGLIIKTYFTSDSPYDRERILERLREITTQYEGDDFPKIYLLHGIMTEGELARLYKFADVGVFPTHGEGSGLHIQECILCGTPVIVTGWSAQMDYIDPRLTRTIEYDMAPIPRELYWERVYEEGQQWAQPSSESLKKEMARLVEVPELYQEALDALSAQKEKIINHCHIDRVKERFDQLLEERGGERFFLPPHPDVDEAVVARRPVAIISPCWNLFPLTRRCVMSILTHTSGVDFKIVLVDNGSNEEKDGTLGWARKLAEEESHFHLIENYTNLGFGKANNIGAAWARKEWKSDCDFLFINNDCFVDQADWLTRLQATCLMNKNVGIVGCKLVDAAGVLLHVGTHMPTTDYCGIQLGGLEPDRNQYDYVKVVQGVVGACMYVRGDVFELLGGFDEQYFAYFEDTAFCFAAQEKGWLTAYNGLVKIYHDQNSTINSNENPGEISFDKLYSRSRSVFIGQWDRKLKAGVVK